MKTLLLLLLCHCTNHTDIYLQQTFCLLTKLNVEKYSRVVHINSLWPAVTQSLCCLISTDMKKLVLFQMHFHTELKHYLRLRRLMEQMYVSLACMYKSTDLTVHRLTLEGCTFPTWTVCTSFSHVTCAPVFTMKFLLGILNMLQLLG